ncbi:MAG: ATP-grasp domain-containing protein [Bdellovibrionales bacterium]|nr:ATP-grasp domain-containing protein [Bdellovibrionales bacterium]
MISSSTSIGILGDGQLAMMLGESAERRKIPFIGFGKDKDSSFARRFPKNFELEIKGQCKSFTLENEFFSSEALAAFQARWHTPICPKPQDYKHFENKIAQRSFYKSLGVPSPQWCVYPKTLEYPQILKTSQGGYDGYGVRFVSTAAELAPALEALGHSKGRAILVEEKVKIHKELAQGVLLDGQGGVVYLPLVESIQQNGICILTLSQPTLPDAELRDAQSQAKAILDKIAKSGIAGLYHFEFFYTTEGRLVMNEGAPRPHNSTHLTLDASDWSQFDLLVEFLNRGMLPLPSGTQIEATPSIMVNLLGKTSGTEYALKLPKIEDGIEIYPKLYLKKENRPGRKMGHVNLVDRRATPLSANEFLALGHKIFKEYEL